jgi:RNA polymerase sigma-70 factor (ECF subfamily)
LEGAVMSGSAEFGTVCTSDDDLVLVHLSQSGDVAAYEELVKRYDRKLLRIAQHVTDNLEDAEEAVQGAFLKAYQNLSQFPGNANFSTWLIRIALNESIPDLRKWCEAKELCLDETAQVEDHDLPRDTADWAPNPEQLCGASELRKILIGSLQELGPGLRTVFVLRDMEGLSTNETADILGLNEASVKARLLRARLQLREKLSRYFRKPE